MLPSVAPLVSLASKAACRRRPARKAASCLCAARGAAAAAFSSSSGAAPHQTPSRDTTAAAAATTTNGTGRNAAADGAWMLLAALEKAREAEGVRVSRLVSSLEALLPRGAAAAGGGATARGTGGAELHRPQTDPDPVHAVSHTSDPAFFRLPDPSYPTGKDIATMLRSARRGRRIDLSTVESLLVSATNRFREAPSILTLPPLRADQKLHVIGDLHGSLHDLEALLGLTGEPGPDNLLVFNGDLADRGDNGVEIICVVCALTLAYPGLVFINRGNHEDLALSVAYGLASEVQFKYGSGVFRGRLVPLLDNFFMSLPLATVVEGDAFIVHGGPPPPGVALGSIEDGVRYDGCGSSRTVRTGPDYEGLAWGDGDAKFSSACEQDHRIEEVVEAMLWSAPSIDCAEGMLENQAYSGGLGGGAGSAAEAVWSPNVSRGAGFKFDGHVLRRFFGETGLTRLVRSHEPVQNGCVRYEISRGGADDDDIRTTPSGDLNNGGGGSESPSRPFELFTVFSASRYPYKEGFNWAAILTLSPDGGHKISRYATEDDEPLRSLVRKPARTSEEEALLAEVDVGSLRRALRAAIGTRRAALERELEGAVARGGGRGGAVGGVDSVPFDDAVDALVRTLNLDGEGLSGHSPRRALASALRPDLPEGSLPSEIDLLGTLDSFEDQDYMNDCSDFGPGNSSWLQAVYAMIDVAHDGVISRDEWRSAVAKVNANLPPGSQEIDADATWKFLDQNGDGVFNPWEWDALGHIMCR